jgi:hypothetical protein
MKGIVDSVDLSALGLLLCFQISTLSLRPAAPDVHVRRAGKKTSRHFQRSRRKRPLQDPSIQENETAHDKYALSWTNLPAFGDASKT